MLPARSDSAAEAAAAAALAVASLSEHGRSVFWTMSDKHCTEDGAEPSVAGIVDTNGLPMGDAVAGEVPPLAGMPAKSPAGENFTALSANLSRKPNERLSVIVS